MSSRPHAFEERLKAELMAIAADQPPAAAPVRSTARRYRIPIALGAVAATVAALVVLPVLGDDGGTSPAYAVSRNDDGTISVHIFHPDGLDGTVRELRELGIAVAVVPRKPSERCPSSVAYPQGLTPGEGGGEFAGARDESAQMMITPETVPPGHTLVVSTPADASDVHPIGFGAVETPKVPSCVPVYADPAKAPQRTLSPKEAAVLKDKQRIAREEREKEARTGGSATASPTAGSPRKP
ncbi:hypothetical protein OHA37_32690 [Streptomyces sp. NBC_00335]|uniref:hypothetical protein n=1 Tax=unclassified Streptomyces TaxID=2593676 RepID=UPI00224FE538|nr:MULTISPECIES: hypothetical protein [unclassified Streptomyces]MCX5408607.1 hypothetical protein [Streptomyces sp. NBC_00086]